MKIMKNAQALTPASPSAMKNVRIELFFSSTHELRERIGFLRSKGITSFNLVNKARSDDLLQSMKVIEQEFPVEGRSEVSMCAHYSVKYNKSRQMDGAFNQLKDFVEGMDNLSAKNELLIITGSGPKGKFNSLTALQRLQKEAINVSTSMAIAFNPFFPDENQFEEEKKRLQQKLETGLVSKVYLQFGTDLERLRIALQFLTKNRSEIQICGSIFLPTRKLISQQKFRPWNGVFLSDEFLASEQEAKGVVLQMMRLYEQFDCEIIIEAPGVRNDKDWNIVESLMKERDQLTNRKTNNSAKADIKDSTSNCDEKDNVVVKRRKTNIATPKSNSNALVNSKTIPPTTMPSEVLAKPGIVLFHSHDVRLHDNVALQMASHHEQVIPVFLWSRNEQGRFGVNGCLEVVLKDALIKLENKLKLYGMQLVTREGEDSSIMLQQICNECNVGAVYFNKESTPESIIREDKYGSILEEIGIQCVSSQSSLLYDVSTPSLFSTGFNGGHFGTLMPFLRSCEKIGEPRVPIPRADNFFMLESMKGPDKWPASKGINDLHMAVVIGKDWTAPILKRFPMSEDDALANMNAFFIGGGFAKYERERSRADIEGSTSKLSAHLRIGTLSPNELYYKIEGSGMEYKDRKTFTRRIIWRDLAYFHLTYFPEMRDKSIRRHYDDTEWCSSEEEERRFDAWKNGKTGYPLVDAGMRELYKTGWMTQPVRMVVASFLVEYLRVNWVKGCEWFHYTLVDADSAINPMMWQNAGRSGIDQWNFIMSPVAASQDTSGEYTRKWVPELAKLPNSCLHKPWEAPPQLLQTAGVALGHNYPTRIISDLKAERAISVESVLKMRRQNQQCNSDRGYDLIHVNGKETVVFTKKEFRINHEGVLMKDSPRSSGGAGKGKYGKAAQKKFLRQKAAAKR